MLARHAERTCPTETSPQQSASSAAQQLCPCSPPTKTRSSTSSPKDSRPAPELLRVRRCPQNRKSRARVRRNGAEPDRVCRWDEVATTSSPDGRSAASTGATPCLLPKATWRGAINVGLEGRYAEYALVRWSRAPTARSCSFVDERRRGGVEAIGWRASASTTLSVYLEHPLEKVRSSPTPNTSGRSLRGLTVNRPFATRIATVLSDLQVRRRAQPRRGPAGHGRGRRRHPGRRAAVAARRARCAQADGRVSAPAATGHRSPPASLRAAGFADVSDLLGGFGAWSTARAVAA